MEDCSALLPYSLPGAASHALVAIRSARNVDEASPNRLFPTAQSLTGKGWEITIQQVTLALAASDELPAEHVLVNWDHNLFATMEPR